MEKIGAMWSNMQASSYIDAGKLRDRKLFDISWKCVVESFLRQYLIRKGGKLGNLIW